MNELKIFARKFAIGLLILIVVDFAGGMLIRKAFFAQKKGTDFRTTYSLDSTTAEVVIIGSSRAAHHYIPALIADSLGLSCFNTGRDGSEVLGNYACFKAIIQRHLPKAVIFELSPRELYYEEEDYQKLAYLLPYYKKHPEIRSVIESKSKFERLKLLSSLYPFNSCLVSVALGNSSKGKDPGIKTGGFLALRTSLKKGPTNNNLPDPPAASLDMLKLDALVDIIKTCKQKGIDLFFVNSPVYDNGKYVLPRHRIDSLFNKQNARFLDYSMDTSFDCHPALFADNSHLNENGARLFSQMLCRTLITTHPDLKKQVHPN